MANKYRESLLFTANALVWDPIGNEGRVIPITTIIQSPEQERGMLTITGHMGPQMHHSISCAVACARHALSERNMQDIFAHNDITVSIPEYDDFIIDGYSAGLPAFASVVGAMMGWESNPGVAFSGEIDDNGVVGKVGGLENKINMAAANGITTVFFPKKNVEREWEQIQGTFLGGEMSLIGITTAGQVLDFVDDEEVVNDR